MTSKCFGASIFSSAAAQRTAATSECPPAARPGQFIDVDATRARVQQGPAVTRHANLGLRKGSLDPATWFKRSNRVNGLAPSRPNLSRTGYRTLPVTLPPTTALQDDRQLPSMRARGGAFLLTIHASLHARLFGDIQHFTCEQGPQTVKLRALRHGRTRAAGFFVATPRLQGHLQSRMTIRARHCPWPCRASSRRTWIVRPVLGNRPAPPHSDCGSGWRISFPLGV